MISGEGGEGSATITTQIAPRAQIAWKPTWVGSIEGMTVNLINKNLWRFTPLFEFDDVFQDCYAVFLMCCQQYPHVVEAPHFTSLYQTCLRNHFHVLARQRSFLVSGCVSKDTGADLIDAIPAKEMDRQEEFAEIMERAPEPIQKLIAGLDRKGRPHKHRKSVGGRRETTASYLARIAKLPREQGPELLQMLNNLTAPA